jgi:hypothetical protein
MISDDPSFLTPNRAEMPDEAWNPYDTDSSALIACGSYPIVTEQLI